MDDERKMLDADVLDRDRAEVVGRLKALELGGGSHQMLAAIGAAVYPTHHGWTTGACDSLRSTLVRLLAPQEAGGDGWVRLPLDADGERIDVGKDVFTDTGEQGTVDRLVWQGDAWTVVYITKSESGVKFAEYANPDQLYQEAPDSWERIISDATALGAQVGRRTAQVDDFVARCRALAGEA